MTMHEALHPRHDVNKQYVSRKEGGRRLASIEDSVDASIQRLKDFVEKHEWWLTTATRNFTDNPMTNRVTITRKQKWEEKQLYGRFKRIINNISHEKNWTWLRKGNLEKETESLRIAAQNNTIRINDIKTRMHKTQQNNKCWCIRLLCDWWFRLYHHIGDRDETINHIISECSKLAQKEYKTRHNWVIYREMCNKFKFDHTNKWYMHNEHLS